MKIMYVKYIIWNIVYDNHDVNPQVKEIKPEVFDFVLLSFQKLSS